MADAKIIALHNQHAAELADSAHTYSPAVEALFVSLGLSDEQFLALGRCILSAPLELAEACLEQGGMDAAQQQQALSAALEPMAARVIDSGDSRFLPCCGRRRMLGHKSSCNGGN